MKVLHLGKYFDPYQGGIENFLKDLAADLASRGVDLSILVHHEKVFLKTTHEVTKGIPVTRTLSLCRMVYAPLAPSFGYHLSKTVREFTPDILHIHLPNLSAFWALFLKKRPTTVLHWHADVVPSKIDKRLSLLYPFYAFFEKRLLEQARTVIVTSQNYLKESLPLRDFKDKCRVIPLGIDPGRLHRPNGHQLERIMRMKPKGKSIVLSVGRFTYYKGFRFLIEAAREVPEACFILVGEGPQREELKQRIARLGLEDRVLLPGLLPDSELHALMAACDIFCLPSVERTEAFGLVLPEAMAFGKPLITTDIKGSGVTWVNQHGETGLVVPPGDPPAIAQAVRSLISSPQTRFQMGSNARERFIRSMHIRNVGQEILTLYTNLD